MALQLFNPARDIFNFPEEMGLGMLMRPDTTFSTALRAMPMDVKETENTYEVKADVPGVQKDDIHVSTEGNVLTLKVESGGEKKDEKEEKGVKYHRVERHSTFVQRSMRFPATADLENVTARYENGVLKLEIPKKQTGKQTKRIAIE